MADDQQRVHPANGTGRKATPEEKAEMDRIVEASRRAVQAVMTGARKAVDPEDATERADRARRTLDKLRYDYLLVRELGGSMPDSFWVAFGKAAASVIEAEGVLVRSVARASNGANGKHQP